MEIEFNGKIIFWRGPSPFHFVSVPAKESHEIKAVSKLATYGWGSERLGVLEQTCYHPPYSIIQRKEKDNMTQPANVVRFRLGNFSCVLLCDGNETLREEDIANMFGDNAERMLAAFRALDTPLGFSRNILLLETGEKQVLIDTGNGLTDPADPGQFLDNLLAANITPESIDTIVISHYHGDHIGGLLNSDGNPTFVNARLVVPKLEHDFWMRDDVLAEMDEETANGLRQTFAAYASRLTLLDDTTDIEPGIRYVPALGHSPGHQAISIESQGERLLHLVDAIHMPIQLTALDVSAFDFQPDIANATRRTILARTDESLLTLAYHFPFPGLGYFKRTGDLLAWEPSSHY